MSYPICGQVLFPSVVNGDQLKTFVHETDTKMKLAVASPNRISIHPFFFSILQDMSRLQKKQVLLLLKLLKH